MKGIQSYEGVVPAHIVFWSCAFWRLFGIWSIGIYKSFVMNMPENLLWICQVSSFCPKCVFKVWLMSYMLP